MIIILAALLGAAYGAWRAKSRSGNGKDMAQYAAVFALIFAMGGLLVVVIFSRGV